MQQRIGPTGRDPGWLQEMPTLSLLSHQKRPNARRQARRPRALAGRHVLERGGGYREDIIRRNEHDLRLWSMNRRSSLGKRSGRSSVERE
jgi:hypothetical protein